MEANLEKLLKKISLESDKYKYFEGGKLVKIVGNKEKTIYHFILELETNLPLSIYQEVSSKLSIAFKPIKETILLIKANKINSNEFVYYYRYFLEQYSETSPLLKMFLDVPISTLNNICTITLNNKAELIKFESIIDNLNKDLSNVGFYYELKTIIDGEAEQNILNEIKEDLKVEIKELPKQEEKQEKPINKYKQNYEPKPLIQDPLDEDVIVGRRIEDSISRMDTIALPGGTITVEAYIFGKDVREAKSGLKIMSLKLTDYTDSIYGTLFIRSEEEFKIIDKKIKVGKWYKIRAKVKDKDQYSQDLSLTINDINVSNKVIEQIVDDAPVKRVELHAHTMMSQMDGVTKLDLGKHTCELVEETIRMGYRGVAITDHSGCQAFPISFGIIKSHNKDIRKKIKEKIEETENKLTEEIDDETRKDLEQQLNNLKEEQKNPPIFKGLYGTELTLVDDTVNIVIRPTDEDLIHSEYVVFDTETTGFNAGGADQMIEIGAVKIKDGEITDRFDELIDPKRHIPDKITELTCITDEMVKGKDDEETVTKRFLEWTSDLPMVAHNAKFDISFIEMAMKKYNLGKFKNTVIDTLELSRTLDQGYARHSLSALVKRYNVPSAS